MSLNIVSETELVSDSLTKFRPACIIVFKYKLNDFCIVKLVKTVS